MKKGEKNKKEDIIKIDIKDSSLLEFTKRDLGSEKEVKAFEDYVKEGSKDEEIEESLNEIYQDENGGVVDVSKMEVLKRRGLMFWFLGVLTFILVGMGVFSYVYNNIYLKSSDGKSDVVFTLEGENEVFAGEEFVYTINYKNLSNIDIKDVAIEVKFPEGFIFLDSTPPASQNNNIWRFDELRSQHIEKIQIKGKIIDFRGDTGVVLASMIYTPANFSSEFRKDASIATVVKDLGVDVKFDFVKTMLVGEESSVDILLKSPDIGFLNSFRVSLEPQENFKISGEKIKGDNLINYTTVRPGVWQIDELLEEEKVLPIRLSFVEKVTDDQSMVFNFYKEADDGSLYQFFKKEIEVNVVKSDLNLNLIANGSRVDQGVEFGQTINYSIVYKNNGEMAMEDVVLMAVLESDFLDWNTLVDESGGIEKGNTLSWTREQLPELEILEPGEEGEIDFSIDVLPLTNLIEGAEYQVNSFVQYTVGDNQIEESDDSQSNTILLKINSNLSLDEQIRYFNDDNIPVGTGSHPPKVGEETTYKVYWKLSNSLHELNDLNVRTVLPEYVFWDAHDSVSVGVIQFDDNTREIKWDIGRLPAAVQDTEAEFSIRVKPEEEDRNKIMVLMTGSRVEAVDSETEDDLKEETKPKTTKLEDDEIAVGDGIVY